MAVDASEIRDNVALGQMISELCVHCLSPDCDWEGTYGNAANHYHRCPKFCQQCKNKGCRREDFLMHAASCIKRKVPCSEYGIPIKNELLNEHKEKRCPHLVEPCPLNCGVLPRYVDDVTFTCNVQTAPLKHISSTTLQ